MKYLSLIITALLALAATTVQAAEQPEKKKSKSSMYLSGQVYDSFTGAKIKAFVTLMRTDSTVVDTTTCWVSGYRARSYYSFEVPRDTTSFIIKTEAEGYEDKYTNFSTGKLGRRSFLEVPEISMKRRQEDVYKDVELDGVVVKGTRIQVAYKGDTIVYDASAFKLPEGSMLDGLIRQLPGAELKDNGDIYINGKKIDYLTLNGKDFFKGDNKVMLENLPYFTVKDLKVFYKDTEKNMLTGRQMEEKDYVMDVTLKREYARGYIANAEIGAGTEDRWTGKLFGMYYDDQTRLSVYGGANNVNEDRSPGSDGEWDPKKLSRGLQTTRQAGMNLSTEDKEKRVSDNLNVRVRWTDSDNEQKASTETYASSGSIFGNSWSLNKNKNLDLNVNNSLNFTKARVHLYTYLNYSNIRNTSASADSTYGESLVNRTDQTGLSRYKRLTMGNSAYWALKLPSEDYLVFDLNLSYTNDKPSESFSNNRTYYAESGTAELRNSFTDGYLKSHQVAPTIAYFIQLPDMWQMGLDVNYTQERQSYNSSYYRLDRLSESEYDNIGWLPSQHEDLMAAFDADNSSTYAMTRRTERIRYSVGRYTDNSSFSIDLPYYFKDERMNYLSGSLDTVAKRSWRAFQPSLYYRAYGKTRRPINLNYNCYVSSPSFSSLMPVNNTTNPLVTHINNNGLRNTIAHTLNGRITFKNDSLGSSVYIGFETRIRQNAVGTRTSYDTQTGAYTYMSDNVDGNWNAFINSGWQRPLDAKKRLRIDLYGKVAYERSVDFAASASSGWATGTDAIAESPLSKVDNVNLVGTAKLTYKLGDLSAGVIGKVNSTHTRGRLDIVRPLDVCEFQYGANVTYTIPLLKLTVATDMTMYSRRGYESHEMNTNELVWNAQLTRSFCKGMFTAKVQAYDLLQQLSSRRYSVNAQGHTETWYNCIPRYVMFSLGYKFSRKPDKK